MCTKRGFVIFPYLLITGLSRGSHAILMFRLHRLFIVLYVCDVAVWNSYKFGHSLFRQFYVLCFCTNDLNRPSSVSVDVNSII